VKTGSGTRFFLLDKPPAQSARKSKSGIHMFATIVGGALALVFIGLPLAIIGLFIQSFLERGNAKPAAAGVESKRAGTEPEAAHSDRPKTSAAGHPPGLATPIVARHHEGRAAHSARNHGRGERRGSIADRHSGAGAPASPADRSAQADVRDCRAN
jgi:hypothetical protein